MKFSRFLDGSRPWEHEDPEVRRKAIIENDLDAEVLESLAATDLEPSVRFAAIERLDNTEFVLKLALASVGEQRRRAAARWTVLICDGPDSTSAIDALSAPVILTEVARCAPDIDLRVHAVERIDDHDALMSLLDSENHSRVHQACIDRIDDESALEAIRKKFMDKDKRVHQIARDKLARHKETRESEQKAREACEEVCASLEALANNEHELALARRLDVLVSRWQELKDRSPGASTFDERAEAAINACRERINAGHAQAAAQEEAIDSVIADIRELAQSLAHSEEKLEGLGEALEGLRQRWPGGLTTDDGRMAEFHRFMETADRARRLWQQLTTIGPDTDDLRSLRSALNGFDWPDGFKEPERVAILRRRLEELENADEATRALREERIETTRNQLKEFERKIDEGNLKGSNKAHSTIARVLDEHKDVLPREFSEEFSRLTNRLSELRDWHKFVTNPKRVELCEQMEALADDAETHPPKKVSQIKSLQDAWKSLGPSDNREAQELWTRFKAASDKAYEPCARFFQEQKQQRADNLRAREAICEELERFNAEHDWTNPDYKALGGLISQSLKAWRESGEVPRSRFKKISTRFDKALGPLQERLAAEHERNRQRKSELVDRVAALAADEETPLPELIEQAKAAQRDWQAIGPAERRKEQKLWKSFRKECDRLFARRDSQRDAVKQEASSAKGECNTVIERLKQRTAQGDLNRGELRQLRQSFDEAASQAGKVAPRKAFQAALKQAERSIEQRAIADKHREIDEIRRRAMLCRDVENGTMTPDAIDAEWETDVEIDDAVLTRLEARREMAAKITDEDRQRNRETAALLCVRAEILAGLESPSEAQSLRMQYQVDRLNRELSQGQKDHRSPAEQMRDLQIEWYCLGGIPADADDLDRRFAAAEAQCRPDRLKAG